MRALIIVGMTLFLAGCGAASTDDWVSQLKDADVVKRRQALRELGARTAEAQRIVPALSESLSDENAYVRRDAAMTLGKFGPDARETVPALNLALKDKDPSVRNAAGSALKKIVLQTAK
jgi:HEAT repeat protein